MADPAVGAFCEWLRGEHQADGRLERIDLLSGPEALGAAAAVRLYVNARSYYEARVDLERGEVQAGFATESRVANDAVEQMVLDNGGDLSELLGDELAELGVEPVPMEHFWDRPAFRYVVRLPLESPAALA